MKRMEAESGADVLSERKAGTVISYCHLILNALINLMYVPILLAYIGQEEYGLYKLLGSFVAYFGVMDFGLNAAVSRSYTMYLARQDFFRMENFLGMAQRCYAGVICILLLASAAGFVFLDRLFAASLSAAELAEARVIFVLLVANLVFSFATQIYVAGIAAHERFVFLRGTALARILLSPLVIVALLQEWPTAVTVVAVQSALNIGNVLLYAWYARHRLRVRAIFHHWDGKLFHEARTLAASVFVVFLVDQVFWQTNQIVLGIYSGTVAVSVYAIASQIYMNYAQFSTVIPGILGPKITKMVSLSASSGELSEAFLRVGRLQWLMLLPILMGFFLYGREFLLYWAGEAFLEAWQIALFIMIPFSVDLIQNLGLAILQAQNRYGFRALVYSGVGACNILLVIPAAKYDGGVACAAVTGLMMFLGNGIIMNWYYARKVHLDIYRFWKEMSQVLLWSSIPFFLGYAADFIVGMRYGLWGFFMKLSAFIALYLAVMYRFSMNEYERGLVKGVWRRVRGKD